MKAMVKFVILILGLLPLSLMSQTVNDVPIKDIGTEYIQIMGVSKSFSNKVTIQVDFGQATKFIGKNRMVLKDENGEVLEFNSMIDSLNFFSTNGYEFVTAYAFSVPSGQQVYHYLLKKSE